MAVKLMWSAQGMILADVTGESSDTVTLENPVYVLMAQQGLQLVPILGLTDKKEIDIRKSELLFNAAMEDPHLELRNHYSQTFGSGIQLLNG